jgi:hypothetical protein
MCKGERREMSTRDGDHIIIFILWNGGEECVGIE